MCHIVPFKTWFLLVIVVGVSRFTKQHHEGEKKWCAMDPINKKTMLAAFSTSTSRIRHGIVYFEMFNGHVQCDSMAMLNYQRDPK